MTGPADPPGEAGHADTAGAAGPAGTAGAAGPAGTAGAGASTDGTGALLTEVALAEAAAHARDGDYAAAVRVLDRLDAHGPASLDLLARIEAQRGRFDAADLAWRQVLELSPNHANATAGRRVLAEIAEGRRRPRPRPVRALVGAGVTVLVAVGAVLAVVALSGVTTGSEPSGTAAHQQEPVDDLRAQLARLLGEQQRQQTAAHRLDARLGALVTALSGPGVRVTRQGPQVLVVFDDGLFGPDSTGLSDSGRDDVERLARRLSGQRVRVTVVGHGVPVTGGPTAGGSTVALARALAASRVLATASGLPLTAFTATTADQGAAPYQGSDPDSRARNRTVTLLVAPADA